MQIFVRFFVIIYQLKTALLTVRRCFFIMLETSGGPSADINDRL